MLRIAIHHEQGIKFNVNKCGLFLKFSSVEKICFQHNKNQVLFSPKLCRLNCALLCDSSPLVMSAEDKNSEVLSYFLKIKGEFRDKSLLFL